MARSSLVVGSLLLTLTGCSTLESAPIAGAAPVLEPVLMQQGAKVGPIASSSTGYTFELNSIYDVNAAMELATPCADCLDGVEQMVEEISDGSCPRISRYEDSYIEITGDCVTAGLVYFEGSVRIHTVGNERITAFDNFALYGERAVFEANGSYRVAWSDSGTERAYNLSFTWLMGTDRDGSFAYDMDLIEKDGAITLSGEVKSEDGTFAVDGASTPVEGCDAEPIATLTLLGADEAVLKLDGAKSCDACGELSLGGGAPESVCR